jgi:rubredoxin
LWHGVSEEEITDIQVYCQNPECGELWGDAELLNPEDQREAVLPYTGFAAYYYDIANCWVCPSCGYRVRAHVSGSQPQLWLQDMSTPDAKEIKRRKRRPAWMGKPNPLWKSGERSNKWYIRIVTLLGWPRNPYYRPSRSSFRR